MKKKKGKTAGVDNTLYNHRTIPNIAMKKGKTAGVENITIELVQT